MLRSRVRGRAQGPRCASVQGSCVWPLTLPPGGREFTPVMKHLSELKLAVIGLGYVGLPLAVEFSKRFPVVAFDVNPARIEALRAGRDATLELSEEELRSAGSLSYSLDISDLADCNVYIVTVPTPVDENKQPDLGGLISASRSIGSVLKRGDIVIYESTVYPGATEEVCIPALESVSKLAFNVD